MEHQTLVTPPTNLDFHDTLTVLIESTNLVLERQEAAFEHLTRLAVWVQDRVVHCEIMELTARLRLEEARGEMVKVWTTRSPPYAPATSSS